MINPHRPFSLFLIILTGLLSSSCLPDDPGNNEQEYVKVANQVTVAADGNYVIAGTVDKDPTGYDFLLMKFDTAGLAVWKKTFDYGGMESAYDLEMTSDNGFILTGTSSKGLYVLKTDADGNKQWENSYGVAAAGGQVIVRSGESGYLIGGFTVPDGQDSHSAVFMIKINPTGELIWSKTNDLTPLNDNLKDMIVNTDGTIMITGYQGATSCCGKGFLIKLNPEGEIIWNKTYDHPLFSSMKQTPDGGLLLGGNLTVENSDFSNRMGVMKVDSIGKEVWHAVVPDDRYSYGTSVMLSGSGYVLTGFAEQATTMNNAVITSIGPDGDQKWMRTYGDAGAMTRAWSVVLTPDDKILAVGEYSNPDKNIGVKIYLVKSDLMGNTIWRIVTD